MSEAGMSREALAELVERKTGRSTITMPRVHLRALIAALAQAEAGERELREALDDLWANAVLEQNLQDDNVAVRIPIDAWRRAALAPEQPVEGEAK
jgi:hypothetical protein